MPQVVISPRVLALPFVLGCVVAAVGCSHHRQADRALAEGIAAQRAGQAARAAERYAAAELLDPDLRGLANNRAVLALAAGDRAAAIDLIAQELASHPTLVAARLNRARLLVAGSRCSDAEPELRALAGLGGGLPPRDADRLRERACARVLLARCRAEAGDAPGVVAALLETPLGATLPSPSPGDLALDALARRTVADAALRVGAPEAALAALASDDRDPDALRLRARALLAVGRPDDARTTLAALHELTHADALTLLWLDYQAGASRGDAAPTGGWPIDAPRSTAHARLEAAFAARRGDWGAARAALQHALAGASQDAELRTDLAIAQARCGALDDARATLDAVLRDAPDAARARALVGALE